MIAVFLSFVGSPVPSVKMLGLGLATAIAVDATLVRMVLVPATMSLLGDANWWLPRWLDQAPAGGGRRVRAPARRAAHAGGPLRTLARRGARSALTRAGRQALRATQRALAWPLTTGGTPVITTVSTVKDDGERLQRWIDRNLAAGVDRMVVFLDDRDDAQTAALLGSRPGVVVVDAATWWGDDFPARLNARQRINANAALHVVREHDPRGWMFHIDGDEVLHLDKERLLALADDVEAVRLAPLEALAQWEWADDEVTVFKRLLSVEELNLLHLLGMLARPANEDYFRGHTSGKSGLRVSSDAWLDIHRVVDDSRTPVAAHRASWLQVLHYESHTFEEFVRKWTNHTTSGHRLVARSERRRLASAMTADGWAQWPAEVADQVRRELFAATALDDRDRPRETRPAGRPRPAGGAGRDGSERPAPRRDQGRVHRARDRGQVEVLGRDPGHPGADRGRAAVASRS